MAKSKYSVTLPICGYVIVDVEAENEQDAIEKAVECDITIDDIDSWDVYKKLVRGNVFYGEYYKAEAEEIDEFTDSYS